MKDGLFSHTFGGVASDVCRGVWGYVHVTQWHRITVADLSGVLICVELYRGNTTLFRPNSLVHLAGQSNCVEMVL